MPAKSNFGIHRSTPTTFGVRRRSRGKLKSDKGHLAAVRLAKPLLLIVMIGLLVTLATTHTLGRRIQAEKTQLKELQLVRARLGNENIFLLSQRAKLMSEQHIENVAARDLQLFRPDADRVHNF